MRIPSRMRVLVLPAITMMLAGGCQKSVGDSGSAPEPAPNAPGRSQNGRPQVRGGPLRVPAVNGPPMNQHDPGDYRDQLVAGLASQCLAHGWGRHCVSVMINRAIPNLSACAIDHVSPGIGTTIGNGGTVVIVTGSGPCDGGSSPAPGTDSPAPDTDSPAPDSGGTGAGTPSTQ